MAKTDANYTPQSIGKKYLKDVRQQNSNRPPLKPKWKKHMSDSKLHDEEWIDLVRDEADNIEWQAINRESKLHAQGNSNVDE